MAQAEKIVLSWSGGKDSALSLYELQRDERFRVVSLLTTVAEEYERISHHGVRTELLDLQAEALGVPLHKLYLPGRNVSNKVYESLMKRTMLEIWEQGVRTVAFGDIFLEDLRAYREANLAKVEMRAHFPIWHRNTADLARLFIDLGFRARLSCVDGQKLDESFAGRPIDEALLQDLPKDVDPCGENGEFHSFVFDGPNFQHPVPVKTGEVVLRDVRYFADLLPASGPDNEALSTSRIDRSRYPC